MNGKWIGEDTWTAWKIISEYMPGGEIARGVHTVKQLVAMVRSRDQYIAELEQHINELVRSAAETQSELSDWQASARDAMRENPDEQHCSCVGPLQRRVEELRDALRAIHERSYPTMAGEFAVLFSRDEIERIKKLIEA